MRNTTVTREYHIPGAGITTIIFAGRDSEVGYLLEVIARAKGRRTHVRLMTISSPTVPLSERKDLLSLAQQCATRVDSEQLEWVWDREDAQYITLNVEEEDIRIERLLLPAPILPPWNVAPVET